MQRNVSLTNKGEIKKTCLLNFWFLVNITPKLLCMISSWKLKMSLKLILLLKCLKIKTSATWGKIGERIKNCKEWIICRLCDKYLVSPQDIRTTTWAVLSHACLPDNGSTFLRSDSCSLQLCGLFGFHLQVNNKEEAWHSGKINKGFPCLWPLRYSLKALRSFHCKDRNPHFKDFWLFKNVCIFYSMHCACTSVFKIQISCLLLYSKRGICKKVNNISMMGINYVGTIVFF